MFALKKKQPEQSGLEKAIDQILTEMNSVTADSPEFAKMVDQLVTLSKALPSKEPRIKGDTWVTVGGNLVGVIAILGFEKFNIVTSKALGLLIKPRL